MRIVLTQGATIKGRSEGAHRRLTQIAQILAKENQVETILLSAKSGREDGKIFIKEWQRWPLLFRVVYRLLAQILIVAKGRYDIVYSLSDWLGFPFYYLMKPFLRHKIIFEVGGIQSSDAPKSIHGGPLFVLVVKFLERFVIGRADALIVETPFLQRYCSRFGRSGDLIPQFIDVSRFSPSPEARKRVRARYSIGEGLKLVGAVGPFDWVYNRHCLDFVHQNINSFDPRIRFLVIGRCHRQVDHSRIIYTGEIEPFEEYMAHVQALDALLVAVNIPFTGTPGKVIEAMSCAVPVFATPQGGIGTFDALEPGKDAMVFEEGELVDKVNQLLFDEAGLEQIARRAREKVVQHYSLSASEDRIRAIINRLAPRKATSSP